MTTPDRGSDHFLERGRCRLNRDRILVAEQVEDRGDVGACVFDRTTGGIREDRH